jgi:acyl carrier protein phosphodiesterase
MNYLAHIFLSGSNNELIVGNFIGDFIKGNELDGYSNMVRKGIVLHRHIDSFTDRHMIVRLSKSRVAEVYHKYSGIIIDIFYDHFLIRKWNEYSSMLLNDFVQNSHQVLLQFYNILPEGVKLFLPSFIKNNWIQKYESIDGVREILERMSDRTTLPCETGYAIEILEKEYDKFEKEFSTFFPLIINYVTETFGVDLEKKILRHISGNEVILRKTSF